MCLIEKNNLKNYLLPHDYVNPYIEKNLFGLNNYLDDYEKIFKFFKEEILAKYGLKDCEMKKYSQEPGIEVEYYFFLKDRISPKDISELSLKINTDLYNFCNSKKIKSYFKTLIVILD